MEDRAVIHVNVAHFAASVERLLDSRLRQRPLLIAPPQGQRTFVFDLSDEAYREGARRGMPLDRARKVARDAEVVQPHPDLYEKIMHRLQTQARSFSPLVERAAGVGHLYLDVSGTGRLFGPAADIAWRLRKNARADLGLDPIWSVAPNKLVAKVASRVVKPYGEYIVEAGDEQQFLQPLPVGLLPSLGRNDLLRLQELKLGRIGDLAGLRAEYLSLLFGRRAKLVHDHACGVDESPVAPADRPAAAIRAGHRFDGDTNDAEIIDSALYRCVEKAGFELRQNGFTARRVQLWLTWTDGARGRGQATAKNATGEDSALYRLARLAFNRACTRRVRVRALGLVFDRLCPARRQLDLFTSAEISDPRREKLLGSVDEIRKKFGADALRLGKSLVAATDL